MQESTPVIRAGLIGGGGRGNGAAENFLQSAPNVQLVAVADLFPEKLKISLNFLKSMEHPGVQVQAANTFTGFDAYKRVLDMKDVDLVLLATPPGFRPMHFEAAIDAGKHVFAEKPCATDVVGVKKVLAAGKKAKEKGLGVLAGTQYRHQISFIETIQRVRQGDIGDIRTGRVYYNTVSLRPTPRKAGWSGLEWQIRNWPFMTWLSGDQIVEQHVHWIDVADWVMGGRPVKATAVGGRQVRTDDVYGNVWDHMAVDYEYPNGLHVMSMCRQMIGTDGYVGAHFTGPDGTLILQHDLSEIVGKKPFKHPNADIFKAYVQEHADFVASIRAGKPLNEAEQIAESTLTGIMGREAAYTGEVLTREALMKSDLDLCPVKNWDLSQDIAVPPVPIPGKKRV